MTNLDTSTSSVEESVDCGMAFFEKVERELRYKISMPLKHILILQQLDQASILANFNKDRVHKLQKFARSKAYLSQLRHDASTIEGKIERKEFFGAYSDNPSDFEIAEGEILQLEMMIDLFKKRKRKFRRIFETDEPQDEPIQRINEANNENIAEDEENQPKEIEPTRDDIAKLLPKLYKCRTITDESLKEKLNEIRIVNVPRKGLHLSCHICSKNLKVCLDKSRSWQVSNFTKHLMKMHSKRADWSADQINLGAINQINSSPNRKRRAISPLGDITASRADSNSAGSEIRQSSSSRFIPTPSTSPLPVSSPIDVVMDEPDTSVQLRSTTNAANLNLPLPHQNYCDENLSRYNSLLGPLSYRPYLNDLDTFSNSGSSERHVTYAHPNSFAQPQANCESNLVSINNTKNIIETDRTTEKTKRYQRL